MEDFNIFVLTWNVATKFPDEDFKQLLGLEAKSDSYINVPDLYVIGFQEVKSQPQNMVWDTVFEDPWTAKAKHTLAPYGLVKINTLRMQGIVTSLFIKRSHLTYIRDMETLWTRRGFGGIWGNKGAVSIRMGIHGCSLCLVNCHLTPHDHLLKERVDDYKNVLSTQIFSQKETSNILFHDYVFWFGDLNFRLDGNRTSGDIANMVSDKQLSALMTEDQLKKVQKTGDAFSELSEMEITFPPTYKFENCVDSYDLKRRPGWPDRILYHVNANVYDNVTLKIDALKYQSHMNYRTSDHRPVTANFRIKVFRPTIEKLIEFIDVPHWHLGENNKVFFRVCPTLDTSPEDWIAIYKSDFVSLEDYIAYVYNPYTGLSDDDVLDMQQVNEPQEASVIFTEHSVALPGSYVLVYFSHASRSVYGVSTTFQATSRLM